MRRAAIPCARWAWVVCGPVLLATVALASTAGTAVPITATVTFQGDTLKLDRPGGTLDLDGNTRIDHGAQTIFADHVTIDYQNNRKTIERMRASGNVRLIEPGRRGRAERADYRPQQRLLVLTGNPIIWEGEDQLAGDVIRIYRDPDRVEVERARAVVAPETLRGYVKAAPAAATSAVEPR